MLAMATDDGELDRAVGALEHEFGVMFGKVRAQTRDRAARVHPELSPAGYNVLAMLVRSGPQHAGALAAALDADKSMISRIVRQLTDLGLVERQADPADGRAAFVVATGTAVERVEALGSERRRRLRDVLAGWPAPDVRQLTALLARLNDAG
jgi:DNA-binding MarR family transcriptional regulator